MTLVGEIDLACEEDLVSTVTVEIGESTPSSLVLDLRAVTFIDSSGLRAVLRCQRASQDAGVAFRVAVIDGPVARLFSVAGVSEWFDYE